MEGPETMLGPPPRSTKIDPAHCASAASATSTATVAMKIRLSAIPCAMSRRASLQHPLAGFRDHAIERREERCRIGLCKLKSKIKSSGSAYRSPD
jgi:hypothetical protein